MCGHAVDVPHLPGAGARSRGHHGDVLLGGCFDSEVYTRVSYIKRQNERIGTYPAPEFGRHRARAEDRRVAKADIASYAATPTRAVDHRHGPSRQAAKYCAAGRF